MPARTHGSVMLLEHESRSSLDELMPVVYEDLRRLAASCLRRERASHTLQPTALVHEVYLRLAGQDNAIALNRAQVLAAAAQMMRRVLINYANQRNASKRDGKLVRVPLTDEVAHSPAAGVDLLELEGALARLEKLDTQQARIVELRFYGGLTTDEVASVVGTSRATVERKWATARLWLLREMGEASGR